MKGIFLGMLLAGALALLLAFLLVSSGRIPANADAEPGRLEIWAASRSLDATLAREAPGIPDPVPLTDANLEQGMRLFATNCAVCHGSAQGDAAASPIATGLYQKPPQFASEGVEDDAEGLSFWKIKHGIRLTAMPSFAKSLSDEQIWTIALFLKHLDKLPASVQRDWRQVRNWPVTGSVSHAAG